MSGLDQLLNAANATSSDINKVKRFKVTNTNKLLQYKSSKGNQPKWFIDNKFLKADYLGYESISEILVSLLLKFTKEVDYVKYDFCEIETEDDILIGCYSENYINDNDKSVSIYRYLSKDNIDYMSKLRDKECADYLLNLLSSDVNISFNVEKYISTILLIDTIILNEDRHLNNINLIIKETGKIVPAPIFDNGLSLLSRTSKYGYECVTTDLFNKVLAKPFNKDFMTQLSYFKWEPLHLDYNKLLNELDNMKAPFKRMEFDRARYILKSRLEEMKDLWVSI